MTQESLIQTYLNYQKEYSMKYGKDTTIVFIEVGSFYEAYAVKENDKYIDGYNLSKLSDILNVIVSKKDKKSDVTGVKNPHMLGFPSFALQKFMKILIDNGFTVVVFSQYLSGTTKSGKPKFDRKLTGIYSAGTFIGEVNSPDSNNILSIYIEEENQLNQSNKKIICVGLSIIDLSTGKSIVHETYSKSNDINYSLDETVKFINSYQPKEILINYKNISISENKLISYLELTNKIYHKINPSKKINKISYQNEFMKRVFPNTGMLSPIEYVNLERMNYARMSYIILLQYSFDHNNDIINNMSKPNIYNNKDFLYLGNNAIYQLNIINTDLHNTQNKFKSGCRYRSLFDVINKTSTAMGRRYLKNALLTPLINKDEINKRYDAIDVIKENYEKFKKKLVNIIDIERMHRKMSLGILNPSDFSNLHYNYIYVRKLFRDICNNQKLKYLINSDMKKGLKKLVNEYTKLFNIEEMTKYNLNDITNSFFNEGYNEEIDNIKQKIDLYNNSIIKLRDSLKTFIDKSKFNKETLHIKNNERDGYYLESTLKRVGMIKNGFKNTQTCAKNIKINNINFITEKFQFKKMPSGNKMKIFHPELTKISDELVLSQIKSRDIVRKKYIECLCNLYNKYGTILNQVTETISLIDFLVSAAIVSKKYNYCRPEIKTINESNDSYIQSKDLRHAIAERIIENESYEYVPNDITIGNNELDGMMIFGINGCGKSTLQKSVGIAIILAQIGYYVPAFKFEYYPYSSLFTRISGEDNLFKGLSSFAIEMLEMRSIIRRCCNEKSRNNLVICDELCRGTENKSSNILTLAFIETLANNGINFISATHLHNIVHTDRYKKLKNVKSFHLDVEYNEETNILIYKRKLKEGSGRSFYGMDVAKYLINDSNFINLAIDIKNELENNKLLVNDKTSRYNKEIYMDHCVICKYKPKKNELPLETHHIIEQKNSYGGFIIKKPHLNKNDASNLCVLCQKCHDKIDHPIDNEMLIIKGYNYTSNGIKLDYEKKKIKKRKTKYDNKIIKIINELNNGKRTLKNTKMILELEHNIKISTSIISKIWKKKY